MTMARLYQAGAGNSNLPESQNQHSWLCCTAGEFVWRNRVAGGVSASAQATGWNAMAVVLSALLAALTVGFVTGWAVQ